MSERNIAGPDESPVADLYLRWTLDCVVEIAYAVAVDFASRPHLYVDDSIPPSITNMRMEYGTAVDYPNASQRQTIMTPLFGKSDAQKPDNASSNSSFQVARGALLAACTAYAERTPDATAAPLEERLRSALIPLRAHFVRLAGRATTLGGEQLKTVFAQACNILKSQGVATVFGQAKAEDNWPLGSVGVKGAKLIEAIGAALPIANELKYTATRFVLLQRVALAGAGSLKLVLTEDANTPAGLLKVATAGYAWGSGVRDYQQG